MDDDHHGPLSDITPATKRTDNKPSHDASIFVGSLPSNVDQGDLSRMLMVHLSEHTQIKNVKVVRDSKGGICAFVQCMDASSATALIDTLYSNPPKPFLGRILRYEPARAFRTLIISYRAPIHLCPVNYSSGTFKGQPTEMELPTAMRIWKHRNSRFHNVAYNSHALRAEENQNRSGPSETEGAFFLRHVKYDEKTLRDLAAYFGSLESFVPVEAPTDGQYPIPHNGPRSSTMDSRCWEVKWQHRDECVSALMTLRRVPHLTVTWAHQPLSYSSVSQRQPQYVSGTPSLPSRFQHQRPMALGIMSPNVTHPTGNHQYPDHVNSQFAQQKYAPQVAMGQGIIHPSRLLENNHDLGDDSSTINPEPFGRHWQNLDSVSPSLERETLSRESELQDHKPSPSSLDEQNTSVPHIAAPDASSIVPGSQLPVTPAASGTFYDNFAVRDSKLPRYGTEKQVDPTTLFVGGLEISGTGAWDEEKVRMIFSRYGGLESIKFVRPINATLAFAFVKFNNLEAPARAVQEEHNRVYEGRAIRVQLRDIYPPKGNWKFVRGRGRFLQHNFNSNRRHNYRPFSSGQDNYVGARDSGLHCSVETHDGPSAFPSHSEPPHQHAVEKEAPGTERFREWYDDLESVHTPPPSSKGSSASITCASYTTPSYPSMQMQNGPYMPPPPWMHPYVSNGTCPLPYYPGYTFYPPSTMAPQSAPMVPSDGSGSAVAVWPSGVYGSFVSYPIGPMRVPAVGQGSSAQPPLIPSGYMQNEHGGLVAVYQQEALNRYMSEPTNGYYHNGGGAFHRAGSIQSSQSGVQHGHLGRNSQAGFRRGWAGKSGRGGHVGRDWNR